MKWRVERPKYADTFLNSMGHVTDNWKELPPDIVEADCVLVEDGCIVFCNRMAHEGYDHVKMYAPGQWVTVERVED